MPGWAWQTAWAVTRGATKKALLGRPGTCRKGYQKVGRHASPIRPHTRLFCGRHWLVAASGRTVVTSVVSSFASPSDADADESADLRSGSEIALYAPTRRPATAPHRAKAGDREQTMWFVPHQSPEITTEDKIRYTRHMWLRAVASTNIENITRTTVFRMEVVKWFLQVPFLNRDGSLPVCGKSRRAEDSRLSRPFWSGRH